MYIVLEVQLEFYSVRIGFIQIFFRKCEYQVGFLMVLLGLNVCYDFLLVVKYFCEFCVFFMVEWSVVVRDDFFKGKQRLLSREVGG